MSYTKYKKKDIIKADYINSLREMFCLKLELLVELNIFEVLGVI